MVSPISKVQRQANPAYLACTAASGTSRTNTLRDSNQTALNSTYNNDSVGHLSGIHEFFKTCKEYIKDTYNFASIWIKEIWHTVKENFDEWVPYIVALIPAGFIGKKLFKNRFS